MGGDPSLCPHANKRMLANGVTMSVTSVCTYSKDIIRYLHVVSVPGSLPSLQVMQPLWS